MRLPRFLTVQGVVIATLACALGPISLFAKDAPADLCSLLSPAQIEKTLHHPFGQPQKSVAPSPFQGIPEGAQCEYAAQQGGGVKVVLIAYADPSESVAKQTFDKLAMWYSPVSKPAIGDAAYIDSKGAIHVLKGKVRYYVAIEARDTAKAAPYFPWATGPHSNSPEKEQLLKDLASIVAAEL